MKTKIAIAVLAMLLVPQMRYSHADTPPPSSVKIKGGTDGTIQGNVGDASKVYLVNGGGGGGTVDQGAAGVDPWLVTGPLTDTQLRATPVPVSGPLTDAQLRATPVGVSGTFFQATQPISASALPLPTGASQEHATAGSPHAARLSDGTSFYKATTPADTQPVSLAAPVNAVVAPNAAGSVSNSASITTTATTFTAPANAVGFILEAENTNSADIRFGVGATASPTVGLVMEPGRDTGYVPIGANISVASVSGTQAVAIQWVLSQ